MWCSCCSESVGRDNLKLYQLCDIAVIFCLSTLYQTTAFYVEKPKFSTASPWTDRFEGIPELVKMYQKKLFSVVVIIQVNMKLFYCESNILFLQKYSVSILIWHEGKIPTKRFLFRVKCSFTWWCTEVPPFPKHTEKQREGQKQMARRTVIQTEEWKTRRKGEWWEEEEQTSEDHHACPPCCRPLTFPPPYLSHSLMLY